MRNVIIVLVLVSIFGCVRSANSDYERYEDNESYSMLSGNEPISNLRDEGFVPLPGKKNTYYAPGTEFVVKCDDRFVLNLSMKKTFHCYYLDRRFHKIPGSDFDVQINPYRGDEDGFSPYR